MKTSSHRAVLDGLADPARAFNEVTSFIRVVSMSPRLGRALQDPGEASAKRALVTALSKGAFGDESIDIIVGAIENLDDVSPVEALAEVAADLGAKVGNSETFESSLHAIGALIDGDAELSLALNDPGTSDDKKADLLRDLLAGKADATAVTLAVALVYADHGHDLARRAFAAEVRAAAGRNKLVATVRTAIELDAEHRARLVESLEQALGKGVEARFSVDPSIIGGVVVRVGDEVFDGTVRLRLEQARVALASAS